MIRPPTFGSLPEYIRHLGDVGFWWPCVAEILRRHGLTDARLEPVAGFNSTYPTFLYGDVVVKLFGHSRVWRASHSAESAALALIATDPRIAAPRLLGEGRLFSAADAAWPYLITTRMAGVASWRADLTPGQRLSLAADLGRQIRRVHALRPLDVATHADWAGVNVTQAASGAPCRPI